MRLLAVALLATGLALAASSVSAQEAATSFTLVAKDQGGAFVWTNEAGGVNPTLVVPPEARVTILARQGEADKIPHNVKVGAQEASEPFAAEGESVTYVFTAPPSGTVSYLCAIHPNTMKGTVRVEGSAAPPENGTPAPGLAGFALALAGAALLASRRR